MCPDTQRAGLAHLASGDTHTCYTTCHHTLAEAESESALASSLAPAALTAAFTDAVASAFWWVPALPAEMSAAAPGTAEAPSSNPLFGGGGNDEDDRGVFPSLFPTGLFYSNAAR